MDSGKENPQKKLKENNMNNNEKSFTPREYQIEILEAARKTNTIACLGTGTGKTFIAIMLIREKAMPVRKPYSEGGKRIFFLVPTVPLVTQQAKTIQDHTDLKVKGFYGDMEVDSWDKDEWIEQFCENEVLVMTAEIFRIIMDHVFIPISSIQLLIIDECHRAKGDHPYRQALKCFIDKSKDLTPLIFGLSASLLNGKCKPYQLEENLRELEMTLQSTILTASDIIDLQKYGTDPNESIVLYYKYETPAPGLIKETQELINRMQLNQSEKEKEKARNAPKYSDDIMFFEKPKKCLNSLKTILETLGPWCAHKAAEMFSKELESLLHKSLAQNHLQMLRQTSEFVTYFKGICQALSEESGAFSFTDTPMKLRKLLATFCAAKRSLLLQKDIAPTITEVDFDDDPEKYIEERANQEKSSSVQLCSIIFVQQRITAFVIQEWLLEVKRTVPELEFLIPEFIVGHGNVGLSQTAMSEKMQRKKLKDFRNKKSNVLVATQVLEEGMDIRQCNLVIRFDLPGDFRSYVQSKGRARAINSRYVMLVEDGEMYAKFMIDLVNFKTIEKMLLSKCHSRSKPEDDEIASHMSDDEIPPYMPRGPDGPRITMNAAIQLINRYCTSLPTDMAYKLVPYWKTEEVDLDLNIKEYVCKLRMPINSPLRQTIVSETMKRTKLAKMSAALKACKLLDEIGELNESLVPISCLVNKAIEDEIGEVEEEDGNGAQPGTNRRRQVYNKGVPIFLKNAKPEPKRPCYLNILEMKLVTPLANSLNPRQRPLIDPADTSRGLALLTTEKLPPINPFKIFTKCGKVLVTVNSSSSFINLNEEEIQRVEKFHRFIFSDALWIEEKKAFLPNAAPASYYIIPIDKNKRNEYEIDWSFMTSTFQHSYNTQKMKSSTSADRTPFNEEAFLNAVLMRSYKIDSWKYERPTFHHVVKIKYELSPNSALDGKNKHITLKEHLYEKYKVRVQNDAQPLVETIQYHSMQMWKPIYISAKESFDYNGVISKTKQRRRDFREYLIPEMCFIHPFPQPFFFKVFCLPTILFRLNGLLLAEEIRQAVAKEAFVGMASLKDGFTWPRFNLETSDKELTEHLYKTGELKRERTCDLVVPRDIVKNSEGIITSFEVKFDLSDQTGPTPSLLLQALTAKNAGDEFDLERLEMIGDSFLKYAMSVKTYIKYRNFDEGRLTKIRSSLIQNLNLYQKAKKKNLGQYLITSGFNCKRTWLPPLYVTEDKIDESTLIKKSKSKKNQPVEKEVEDPEKPLHRYFTKQVISDKCIADSVEALIGSYLLTCGHQGALRFMSWFGLKPLIEDVPLEEDFENWPPSPPNPIVGDVEDVQHRLDCLTGGFDRFEKIIGYKFRNKAYLLQAFTHPSYSYNDLTDCYQRLEFLGDAVLDYMITRQLYEDPCGHSPGKLTDLRSALVNNMYFASLAVVYKYHDHLKLLSPQLFRLVNRFLEVLEDSEGFQFFQENRYYLAETECFELEEVEVPKALGDVFESVAGAIYLDSGMSLDTVWKVCFPMIKPAFDHLCQHVPVSPVRELYELVKTQNIFSEHVTKGDKTYIQVILPDGRKFEGVGPNKKVAKKSAAKRALAVLKAQDKMDTSE